MTTEKIIFVSYMGFVSLFATASDNASLITAETYQKDQVFTGLFLNIPDPNAQNIYDFLKTEEVQEQGAFIKTGKQIICIVNPEEVPPRYTCNFAILKNGTVRRELPEGTVCTLTSGNFTSTIDHKNILSTVLNGLPAKTLFDNLKEPAMLNKKLNLQVKQSKQVTCSYLQDASQSYKCTINFDETGKTK
ncbi:MAG: hypothetical protein HY072_10085 [Deltaproteobacteria bacterium]|nr:hypothetical protein [Deltaproteobacteria bacterium]